jgi:hypothetical protein
MSPLQSKIAALQLIYTLHMLQSKFKCLFEKSGQ